MYIIHVAMYVHTYVHGTWLCYYGTTGAYIVLHRLMYILQYQIVSFNIIYIYMPWWLGSRNKY